MDAKIDYTKPKQIPLFEEQEDGSLKQYQYEEEKLCPTYENEVFTFKLVIIATTDANLELMIRQAKEVFDRYTSAPFATDTNSNTYRYARLTRAETEPNPWNFVADAWVQLADFLSSVVIA